MSFVAHVWQLNAVAAFDAIGGCFLGQPPGAGKTWVLSECLKRGQRPLLVCPASARTQTRKLIEGYGAASAYASYTQVSRDEQLLERFAPDVLAVDESQALKNVQSSAWGRRIARYIAAHPETRVVCSSGSVMHRSSLDYMPQLRWALRGRAPCPQTWAGMQAAAREHAANPEAWLETLLNTPGVFIESAPSWHGELVIREHRLEPGAAYLEAWRSGQAPDGWAVEGFGLAELLRQLSWGWYMGRDPRPSPRLIEARRLWTSVVADAKARGLCDTPLGARTHAPDAWRAYAIATAAEPEGAPTPVWLDADGAVQRVEELLCQLGFKEHLRSTSGLASASLQRAAAESGQVIGSPAGTANSCSSDAAQTTRIASRTLCTTDLSLTACASVTAAITQRALSLDTCFSGPRQITIETAEPRDATPQASDTTHGEAALSRQQSAISQRLEYAPQACAAPGACTRTCIIWVKHVALGELLSARLCIPYHREGGRDAAGIRLDEARLPLVLASIDACSKAFNAQHFNAQVWLEPPADARVFQQGIARCARQGQLQPRVTCDIVVASPQFAADLATAKTLARQIEKETGQRQLLLTGEKT